MYFISHLKYSANIVIGDIVNRIISWHTISYRLLAYFHQSLMFHHYSSCGEDSPTEWLVSSRISFIIVSCYRNRTPSWTDDVTFQQTESDIRSFTMQPTYNTVLRDQLVPDNGRLTPMMTTETISGYQLRYPVRPCACKEYVIDVVSDVVECSRRDGNVSSEECAATECDKLSTKRLNYCHVLYDSSLLSWHAVTFLTFSAMIDCSVEI